MASRAGIEGKSGLGLSLIDRGEKAHVSDVVTSKGDQPAQCADCFRGRPGAIPTSRDEHLIAPNLSEELVRLQTVVFHISKGGRVLISWLSALIRTYIYLYNVAAFNAR